MKWEHMLKATMWSLLILLSSVTTTANSATLKIWTLTFDNNDINVAWKKLIKDYEAENPGTTISLESRSIDQHKAALRIAAKSSQGPDIYFMWAGPGLGGEFIHAGLALPMDKYYEQYHWDQELLSAATAFSKIYKNHRYGIPYTFHAEGLYFNKALFKKAGITTPPSTYTELKADAEKLKQAGIPAFTFGGSVNWHLMRLMDVILETQCGAKTHDSLTNLKISWAATPCVTQSFAELSDWAQNYILSPFMGIDQAQSFNLFLANRAAMMLEGDWLVGQLNSTKREKNFDTFLFPTDTNRLYGFAEYFYISSKSKHQDAAAKFLNYLISTKVQQENLGIFNTTSVNRHVKYNNPGPLTKKWMATFEQYQQMYLNGDQALPLDVTTEYWRVINQVAAKNLTPKSAAEEMQKFINEIQ
ncbi:ABC transporter substrate-binding protein [Vibrio salinus]|uniref:ABC transporter substrate-binding protein n=1 Tax=Vibrio salinus TaxID=2899784 RepID=UPI001E548D5B|nr:extracellular solute-binding protein [Vibrio salinus]MCE0492541.1 extracellular solute-binding protein [Vibrio salinus]